MLKVQKVSQVDAVGEVSMILKMTSEEAQFLLTYALNDLIDRGLAQVEEQQEQLDLFNYPPEFMGNA